MSDAAPTHRMHSPDRRQQLLESALDVFSRRGFAGATTKEVAKAAGVTEAIVFRHFPSKQDLYSAVLDYKRGSCNLEEWLRKTGECMERNDDEGLFKAIAGEILRSYRADPRFERTILFAALEGHQVGLEYHRRLAIPIAEGLTEYIVRRQREGALRPFDPRALLCAVAGTAQQYAMITQMFGFDTGISDQEAIDTFVNIILKGAQA